MRLGVRQPIGPRGVELGRDHRGEGLLGILPARIDDLDVAAERLEDSRRVLADRQDSRIDRRVAEVGRPRHVEPLHVRVTRLEIRAGFPRQRFAIAVVAAGDDVEHRRRVADGARDRPDVPDVLEAAEHRAIRDAPERGLQAVHAAERGRNADRAAAVGSERQRADPARHRRGGAAARAAGRQGRVPRIARDAEERVLGERLVAELRGVGLAKEHRAGRLQAAHRERVVLGDELLVEPGAAGGREAARREDILDRDGHAMERPDGLALHDGDLRFARGDPRGVGGYEAEGVERRIDRLEAREHGVEHLERLHLFLPDEGRELESRAPGHH